MDAQKCLATKVLRSLTTAVLLTGLVWPVLPASAQQVISFGPQSRAISSSERVSERDVESLIQILRLDDDQRDLVRALYEGHRAAWQEGSSEHRALVRSIFESAREGGNYNNIGPRMNEAQKNWTARGEALERDFFESVRGLLSPDQAAAWPRFERDHRRRSLLANESRLSGEGLDLIDVSESLDLEPAALARLDPVSSVYADDVDRALTERSRALEALQKKTSPVAEGAMQDVDPEVIKELQSRVHEKRLVLRDLHERYLNLFEGQLGGEAAARFRELCRLRAFPGVYRPTAADRYLDTVADLPSLNEEQQRALASITDEFDRQVAGINDQLAQLIRTEETERQEDGMFLNGPGMAMNMSFGDTQVAFGGDGSEERVGVFMMSARAEGEPAQVRGLQRVAAAEPGAAFIHFPTAEEDDSPRGKLSRSKRDLVSRTIEAAHALLSREQQAAAPKPDERQRLAPEERARLRMREALENAVIRTADDGGREITITVEPSSGGQRP